MRLPKLSSFALAVVVSGAATTPGAALACSCVSTSTTGAAKISGVVGSGSAAITNALFLGFQSVGSTVDGSFGTQTKSLTDALNGFTKTIVQEVQKLPVYEQQYEANLDRVHPARHASNSCSYADRTGDTIATERLTSLQEVNLNSTSSKYNTMTSSYPEGVNRSDRFMAQTGTLLRERPSVVTSGMDFVSKPGTFGALTAEQLQDASIFINLTTNPNPPARIQKPTSPAALKSNVKADLYNLRMSIPQAVQNQLLAYDAPVMQQGEDTWLGEQLSRISPNAAKAFEDGDILISKSDMLKLMALHRVKDAGWVANLAAKDAKGAIKDLALIKADSLAMDYELWVQDRNTTLLMSQLLAAQNRKQQGGL